MTRASKPFKQQSVRVANAWARRAPVTVDTDWLREIIHAYRPIFSLVGFPLPGLIQFRFGKMTSSHHQAEYFPPNRIVVAEHWLAAKPQWKKHRILCAIVHELCHAAADRAAGRRVGHNEPFMECAKRMALDRDHIPQIES